MLARLYDRTKTTLSNTMPNESLMPSPSLARLIGILEQMLQCIRSRMTPSAPGTADPVTAVTPIENQRRHVEWLCDHDVRYAQILYMLLFAPD